MSGFYMHLGHWLSTGWTAPTTIGTVSAITPLWLGFRSVRQLRIAAQHDLLSQVRVDAVGAIPKIGEQLKELSDWAVRTNIANGISTNSPGIAPVNRRTLETKINGTRDAIRPHTDLLVAEAVRLSRYAELAKLSGKCSSLVTAATAVLDAARERPELLPTTTSDWNEQAKKLTAALGVAEQYGAAHPT